MNIEITLLLDPLFFLTSSKKLFVSQGPVCLQMIALPIPIDTVINEQYRTLIVYGTAYRDRF